MSVLENDLQQHIGTHARLNPICVIVLSTFHNVLCCLISLVLWQSLSHSLVLQICCLSSNFPVLILS